MQIQDLSFSLEGAPQVKAKLNLPAAVLFEPDIQIQVLPAEGVESIYRSDFSAAGYPVAWLPRGVYSLQCRLLDLDLPPGDYRLRVIVFSVSGGERKALGESSTPFSCRERMTFTGLAQPAWQLQSAPGTVPIEELAWNRGHEDWFFRHFDHAALVVSDYLLKKHPLLKGRILDVGCGDGIIDLGIFLRMQPEELIGIDPFRGFDRLPEVAAANHLPADVLNDERLQFRAEDGNTIPYPDDHFDVVLSWGSLEHIAGGYRQTLIEIRRVLKNGGLFFVHPGLYYGAVGNHLGEFFDDPFIHLKLPEAELREAVLTAKPRRMDRAGHVADPEEYWQWYTELNPIRVGDFEQELRELGFEPWRVALRTSDIIEYTPELQGHRMQDLATAELYLSAWNRK
ncbi:MAG: class I SAM-dependent methyltransferase [Xanthomonadales bacterium]|nr:class I SAM-dependent methyltransferase [Gammaproteobacteria bacterium]MBT8053467.1 class I SAM-dependent methyltransferase [Gammaproteobacteria bacterium]NNK50945.1 class I SAM-dependent methyltransferase [Xanthomonadales bacterium]